MKVISIIGKKLTVDLSKKEEIILFQHGLQLMVDKLKGKGKFKVLPYDKSEKILKKTKRVEFDDKDYKKCIEIAIFDAIETYVDKCESKNKVKK